MSVGLASGPPHSPRETMRRRNRTCLVPKIARMFSMVLLSGVAALVVLALATQAGVLALQRLYPQQGWTVDVAGARLNVAELGPRDAAGAPVLMIHGASSNLES